MQRIIVLISHKAEELLRESCRKIIHALIAFVPMLACRDRGFVFVLLGAGIVVYAWSEMLRLEGIRIPLISAVKDRAFRTAEVQHFAMAPVTLACGAMFALRFYSQDAMTVAVYSLAFSDSFACLVGKTFGYAKLPFSHNKSWAGSAACFLSTFLIAYHISGGCIFPSVVTALAVTLTEMLPAGDFDNFLIPLIAGAVYSVF
ncbi:MAG: phosphatidate cytidylyltransferase [Spirochaetia bacterium]|nr:phosphatidate cytidylyltransferase [Spirochaetia bacterium]